MVKQRINCEVLIELMNNPLGVSTNKGNQGTTRGKHISSFVNSSCLQGSLGVLCLILGSCSSHVNSSYL